MEISKPLYIVSMKGTWKFPNPFALCLWKEHGNFQAPLRCVCERNMEMEISKPLYVCLWKEHGNFQTPLRCVCERNMKLPSPFTLCLWKEHGNFQVPLHTLAGWNMEISRSFTFVASYADILLARHAIFHPNERLLNRAAISVHGDRPITDRLPLFGNRNFDLKFVSCVNEEVLKMLYLGVKCSNRSHSSICGEGGCFD